MKNIIIIFIILIQYGCANDNYYYKNNQKITITPDISVLRSETNIDYYKNTQGLVLGVTDKLIVKLKDARNLKQILKEFNLILKKTLGKNLYLLRNTDKKLTIDISNRLNENEQVEYAHPDFMKKTIRR